MKLFLCVCTYYKGATLMTVRHFTIAVDKRDAVNRVILEHPGLDFSLKKTRLWSVDEVAIPGYEIIIKEAAKC